MMPGEEMKEFKTVTIEDSKEFELGDYQVWREGSCTFFAYKGPNGPEVIKKENKSYTEEDLLIYIHKLRSNWEDLKKWLVEKSDACRLKGTATESLRWGYVRRGFK